MHYFSIFLWIFLVYVGVIACFWYGVSNPESKTPKFFASAVLLVVVILCNPLGIT